eukprot:scaffold204608_cov24-Attheya_sp.AAC.1
MSSTIDRSLSSSSSSDNEGKGSRFGFEMPEACAKVMCTLNKFAGGNPSMPASRCEWDEIPGSWGQITGVFFVELLRFAML